ncbi:MAG: hypothetical protein AAGG59_04230 [Bacteroidota bacterium]
MGESNLENLRKILKDKEAAVRARTISGINDHPAFRRLLALLTNYEKGHPLSGFIAVILETEDVESFTERGFDLLYDNIDTSISNAHNHIALNSNGEIVSSDRIQPGQSGNDVRRLYEEMSKEYVVFLLSPNNIQHFIDGNDAGETIFFTNEDKSRYAELKEISDIKQLFEDYRLHLTIRNTYSKFFASNSAKRAILEHQINSKGDPKPTTSEKEKLQKEFFKKHQHLLENKPEDRFREDLRHFLDQRLKGDVYITKEHILESFKRIDIFIRDEFGELYLIEVKWVGTSVHATGTKIGTSFNSNDINPEAIVQTVKYLKELYENKTTIKIGYLVVFDSRDNDLGDTIPSFDESNLDSDHKPYYKRFEKIPDFRALNLVPST